MYSEKKVLIGGNIEDIVLKVDSLNDLIYIDGDDEFFDFQNAIRQSLGNDIVEKPDPDMDPRIRRVKAKGRYRDRIVAKTKDGITFESSLVGICCMGLGINPLNIEGITIAAIKYLTEAY